jgi:DNA-binding transcriptional ArsR family regulator
MMTPTDTSVEPEVIIELVSREAPRCILAMASDQSYTAEELADEYDVSTPTVYRHVGVLQEHGFLEETIRIDRFGDHRKAYETTLERVCLTFVDGMVGADIHVRQDFINKFSSFWSDLEQSGIELRW